MKCLNCAIIECFNRHYLFRVLNCTNVLYSVICNTNLFLNIYYLSVCEGKCYFVIDIFLYSLTQKNLHNMLLESKCS